MDEKLDIQEHLNGAKQGTARAGLSREQLDMAEHIGHGKWSELKKDRQLVKCYTIDNVPKETPSDRDDGIYVERVENPKHGETYRVYVTIADVAAQIPLSIEGKPNPLANAAWQRAFTIYRPWGNDSMFPSALEHLMSLEHKKDRLGLTVAINLDEHFQILNTEFIRSKVNAKATDYKGARDRIDGVAGQHPEQVTQFRLMNEVGKGIREKYFGNNPLESDVAREEMVYPLEQSNAEPYAFKAQKMVETYMLLANHAVADFFHKTKLPFLYRNFDEAHAPTDGPPNRAYYSTALTEHTELMKMGLKGAYCHFTSPIRRAPDFYNGHMVHYVIDVMNAMENVLIEHIAVECQPALHAALWKRADDVMAHRTDATKLQKDVTALLKDAGYQGDKQASAVLREKIKRFVTAQKEQGAFPLTTQQLETYAQTINDLNHHETLLLDAPEIRTQWKDKEKIEKSIKIVRDAVEQDDAPARLQQKNPQQFSVLLYHAAACGLLPKPLKDEAVNRLKKQIDTAISDPSMRNPHYFVDDAFSIMCVAQHPENSDWIDLKKLMSKVIKSDPQTVNNVFVKAQREGAFPPAEEWNVDADMRTASYAVGEGRNSDWLHTALVVMPSGRDKHFMAAPYFSLGKNSKSAQSHAKYSFLEHFAFGQLQTMGQQAIPNEAYAQLGSGLVTDEAFIARMAESIGADVKIEKSKSSDGREQVKISVMGGNRLMEPVVREGKAKTIQDAIDKTIKRIMRVPAFKDATALALASELHESLNPRTQLENEAKERGYKVEIETVHKQKYNPSRYEVTVSLHKKHGEETYTAVDSNIQRATDAACVQALEGMGWLDPSVACARSWAGDARRVDAPADRAR